jgi:hypothetical protein
MYTVVVPPNATATLKLKITEKQRLYQGKYRVPGPDTYTKYLEAGTYTFELVNLSKPAISGKAKGGLYSPPIYGGNINQGSTK